MPYEKAVVSKAASTKSHHRRKQNTDKCSKEIFATRWGPTTALLGGIDMASVNSTE